MGSPEQRPQPTGKVVVGWCDTTAQKQGEPQYQALAENPLAVLTRWDADLRLCYASAGFAPRIGWPPGALLGCTFGELELPADLSEPYLAALRRVFDTGQPQDHYYPLPAPGSEGLCHSRLVPELRHGWVAAVLGIAREYAEEALRHAAANALQLQLADAGSRDASGSPALRGRLLLLLQNRGRPAYYPARCGGARAALGGGHLPARQLALLQAVIEAGQPFALRAVRQPDAVEDSLRALCLSLAVIACLAVPVLTNGQLVGVLCQAHAPPRAWTTAETNLAAEVAKRTWVAVAQGHAQEALRRRFCSRSAMRCGPWPTRSRRRPPPPGCWASTWA